MNANILGPSRALLLVKEPPVMTLVMENVAVRDNGKDILAGINLKMEEGTLHGLLSTASNERTTLLRVLAGLVKPCGGRLLEKGVNITGLSPRKRNVAVVYQEFINYPNLTVFENIASPLRRKKRKGFSKDKINQKVEELAMLFGLKDLLKRLPTELSGGQQQRCAFARALAKDADLLLLDDPLVNLDYKLREQLREELKDILKKGSSTVVYATADPREALSLGGDTIVLQDGQILQHDKARHVFERPVNIRTAQMMSEPPMNFLKGCLQESHLVLGEEASFPVPPNFKGVPLGECLLGIRPGNFSVLTKKEDHCLEATLIDQEFDGLETYSFFKKEDGLDIQVQRRGIETLIPGEQYYLKPNWAETYIFELGGPLLKAPFGVH